ncbi:aminodeoxychorismate synthase component I [Streptomyces sp. NPDC002285]
MGEFLRTLLIDNHDSYTFNLFQIITEVNGVEPIVIANDDTSLLTLDLERFDNIVISPGPGRPEVARDLGHVPVLLRSTTLPVLGICLGHQAIAHMAGGTVDLAPQPRHGHLTTVTHGGDSLFTGIPTDFVAVRYHSLCVAEPLPESLAATAWAEDGVVMALRHRQLPRWGVQFHPESIASEYGWELFRNFHNLSIEAGSVEAGAGREVMLPTRRGAVEAVAVTRPPLSLISTVVPGAVDAEATFREFFADAATSFWLDSSRVEPGLSRFSFLGDTSGPLSEVLTYRLSDKVVLVRDTGGVHVEDGGILELLNQRLRERRIPDPGLPFDFCGGYVGYFGYEMKADCGARRRHEAETPDAVWIFADRLIAIDHQRDLTYVIALHGSDLVEADAANGWIEKSAARLAELLDAHVSAPERKVETDDNLAALPQLDTHLIRNQARYEAEIEECRHQLMHGESYEICLTNKVRIPFEDDDLAFYRRLRHGNPAPYAALLRVGEFTVFSSSPECFLRIEKDRTVESKPIKGTAPRSADPVRDAALAAELAADAKTQAENLMIVDLVRNDLGRVCEVGSVSVPAYMAVESYATVHQLVSTIRGQLRPEVGAIDCVRQCFPGGSMTGAPKLRTMEILDRLETEARGIYSGTLGYFGLAGGADLSIVIRTAVRLRDQLTIGAGGAIVLDSDARAEFEEMVLKAAATLKAWRQPVAESRLGVR